MKANSYQKKLIHTNAPNRDIKEEYVQWATEDVSKISCNDLSFDQANAIIVHQLGLKSVTAVKEDTPLYWGFFDKDNQQHKFILSLLRQLNWTKLDTKYGRLADIERFGAWLQSDKSPVNKPLKAMDPKTEVKRIIVALESMISKKYK